ncbi:MAG: thioester reductase domain-containing protein [Cyanobacteria bacterium P01_E01_bin.42]
MKSLDLLAEARLDPDIKFDHSLPKNDLLESWLQPKSILLTGATGFLGAHLLAELIQKTKATIYCLVRCDDFATGKERIKANLEHYLLWNEEFARRIITIKGDLAKPHFDLSQEQFEELSDRIDVIYHNGAWVNSFYPYATLKPANVLATQEILRLASYPNIKPVHFISTIGVFFSPYYFADNLIDRTIQETDLPTEKTLKGGYKQSKWVAEQLILKAKEKGLPACIYRPGRIMGHSKTGIAGNLKDILYLAIKACIAMGKFPDVDTTLNIVPMDYVSQAIVSLSQQSGSIAQQSPEQISFHLLNPQPIPWKKLIQEIQSLGYNLEETHYQTWVEELKRYAKDRNDKELYSISRLFFNSQIKLFARKPLFDIERVRDGLANTSIACPTIDRKLLSVYLSYWHKIGEIPESDRFD